MSSAVLAVRSGFVFYLSALISRVPCLALPTVLHPLLGSDMPREESAVGEELAAGVSLFNEELTV